MESTEDLRSPWRSRVVLRGMSQGNAQLPRRRNSRDAQLAGRRDSHFRGGGGRLDRCLSTDGRLWRRRRGRSAGLDLVSRTRRRQGLTHRLGLIRRSNEDRRTADHGGWAPRRASGAAGTLQRRQTDPKKCRQTDTGESACFLAHKQWTSGPTLQGAGWVKPGLNCRLVVADEG